MDNAYPDRRLERLPAVIQRIGMSRSWIYREMNAGRFPQKVKIGGASGWVVSELERWVDDLTTGSGQAVAQTQEA